MLSSDTEWVRSLRPGVLTDPTVDPEDRLRPLDEKAIIRPRRSLFRGPPTDGVEVIDGDSGTSVLIGLAGSPRTVVVERMLAGLLAVVIAGAAGWFFASDREPSVGTGALLGLAVTMGLGLVASFFALRWAVSTSTVVTSVLVGPDSVVVRSRTGRTEHEVSYWLSALRVIRLGEYSDDHGSRFNAELEFDERRLASPTGSAVLFLDGPRVLFVARAIDWFAPQVPIEPHRCQDLRDAAERSSVELLMRGLAALVALWSGGACLFGLAAVGVLAATN